MDAKFLLLLGVSGVGKSSIIAGLKALDERFIYISPYTTRPIRDGETDKFYATKEQMDKMMADGELSIINYLYGNYYGTPKKIVDDCLAQGQFPVLDWPVQKVAEMQKLYPIYCVYIAPPSIEELKRRLGIDGREKGNNRTESAIAELEKFQRGEYSGSYDISVVSKKESLPEITLEIYESFMRSLT